MRTFSFGGGCQSMAVLVLAATGRVQYDEFVFSNVGDDSENPDTIAYVERYAKPYAAAHGLPFVELQRIRRNGKSETLLQDLTNCTHSVNIPVYMANGAPGDRNCTREFKAKVVANHQKRNGATLTNPAIIGLGISMDEIQRARTDSRIAWQVLEYPLLDLRMNRRDCVKVIESAGLPVPPKSSCWFCPFHRRSEWQEMKRTKPELFAQAVELENLLNERRAMLGRDRIYMHASLVPLANAVGDQMAFTFEEDDRTCDTGHCFI